MGMEIGAVWVWASDCETGRHIKKIFDDANFVNPVRLVDSNLSFEESMQNALARPLVGLVDLALPHGKAWNILEGARALTGGQISFIALLEAGSESFLDRAYDAGVKSYLTKPFAFAPFLERARLLNMHVSLTGPAHQ